MIVASCQYCSNEFKVKWYKQVFCSLSCSAKFHQFHTTSPNYNKIILPVKCETCSKEFKPNYKGRKFCSRSCSGTANNIKYPKRCRTNWKQIQEFYDAGNRVIDCQKQFNISSITFYKAVKSGLLFTRKALKYDEQYIERWKKGEVRGGTDWSIAKFIKDFLLKEVEYKCSKCGWSGINPVTNKTTLQINHKNGNGYDHRRENLEVLCPNCHSLTSNFGNLNKGKGRKYRYKN